MRNCLYLNKRNQSPYSTEQTSFESESDKVNLQVYSNDESNELFNSFEFDGDPSSDNEDENCDIAGMFVSVNVEMSEDEHYESTKKSDKKNPEEDSKDFKAVSDCLSLTTKGELKSKGIIAKLAQKLNSKLNSVYTPHPTDSLLACFEPAVPITTSVTLKPGSEYVCPWCPFTTSRSEMLQKHTNLCRHLPAGNPSYCEDIKSTNWTDGDSERPYSCGECGKAFARSWHLKRHFIIHTGERPFICLDCGNGFSTGFDLKIHQKEHAQGSSSSNPVGGKPFICKICSKAFATSDNLLAHRRTHSNESSHEKGTFCQLCWHSFKNKDIFRNHMCMHREDEPFFCQLCYKSFNQFDLLKNHMQNLHKVNVPASIEEIFTCILCKKEFNQLYLLKRHLQVHRGEKPYKCNDCGESFRGANDLKVHKRIHTGERPFICSECGESFTQKGNLTVHIRTHTGERPFECQLCGRCFLKSSNLKEHMKVHQDGRGKRIGRAAGGRPPRFLDRRDDMMTGKLTSTDMLNRNDEVNMLREAIAGKLKQSNNFKETLADRLKQTGMLSFGGGKIQLRLINVKNEAKVIDTARI